MELADLSPHAFPALVQTIAQHCGWEATLAFVEAFGGKRLRIPQKPAADHVLVRRLGPEYAARLCDAFGGEEFRNIPKCQAALHRIRNGKIRLRINQGATTNDLVEEFGLTGKRIEDIVRGIEAPRPSRNQDLFGE